MSAEVRPERASPNFVVFVGFSGTLVVDRGGEYGGSTGNTMRGCYLSVSVGDSEWQL